MGLFFNIPVQFRLSAFLPSWTDAEATVVTNALLTNCLNQLYFLNATRRA